MSYRLLTTNTVPPGGWRFFESQTGEWFKGGDYLMLVSNVQKHRRSNNLSRQEEAQVAEDVQDQICKHAGHEWCEHMKAGQWGFSIDFDKIKAGTAALVGWAATAFSGQDPYVDQGEANRRAEICSKCCANQAIKGCYGCGLADRIREFLVDAKGARSTPFDDKLQACLVCGCANQAQAWIKPEIL